MTLFAAFLTVLLILLVGGLLAGGAELVSHDSLRYLGHRIVSRWKSTQAVQSISTPEVKTNKEFVKWLCDWRADNQPTRVSTARLSPEKSSGTNKQRYPTRARIATIREANRSVPIDHEVEEKKHAS